MGLDIRSGQFLNELDVVLKDIKNAGCPYEILFLDCSTEVLVKRYKETRRLHPLSQTGRVDKGIETERERLDFLRKKADVIIDTSHLLIRELKAQIDTIYVDEENLRTSWLCFCLSDSNMVSLWTLI